MMSANRFQYQILRYIPDLRRMEPRNFGVIVQGAGQTRFKINTRFAQKGFVDTEAFRQWKQFLVKEIDDEQTEQLNLFRPAKDTPEFLNHLNRLLKGNVNLSKPLAAEYRHDVEIEAVLQDLFDSLVMDREEREAVMITRPTGKFRADSEGKQFIKRGLHKDEHVDLDVNPEWIGYRFYQNGRITLIEKVEFNHEPRQTAWELNGLLRLIPTIPDSYLANGNRFHLIIDPHKTFPNQKEEEVRKYLSDREKLGNLAISRGIPVYANPSDVQSLIDEIDGCLPHLKEAANF
jgi:hypothetical protein